MIQSLSLLSQLLLGGALSSQDNYQLPIKHRAAAQHSGVVVAVVPATEIGHERDFPKATATFEPREGLPVPRGLGKFRLAKNR